MVSLEYLSASHVPELARIAADPQISRTSGVSPTYDLSTVGGWLTENHNHPRKEITFTIVVDRTVVGCCILKKVDWQGRQAELSYWLGVDFWGRGIATAAAALMRDFAFDCFNFIQLHAHYLRVNNAASGQILGKLGFVVDTSRADVPVEGRFQPLAPDKWTFCVLDRVRWQSMKSNSSWALQPTPNQALQQTGGA